MIHYSLSTLVFFIIIVIFFSPTELLLNIILRLSYRRSLGYTAADGKKHKHQWRQSDTRGQQQIQTLTETPTNAIRHQQKKTTAKTNTGKMQFDNKYSQTPFNTDTSKHNQTFNTESALHESVYSPFKNTR